MKVTINLRPKDVKWLNKQVNDKGYTGKLSPEQLANAAEQIVHMQTGDMAKTLKAIRESQKLKNIVKEYKLR